MCKAPPLSRQIRELCTTRMAFVQREEQNLRKREGKLSADRVQRLRIGRRGPPVARFSKGGVGPRVPLILIYLVVLLGFLIMNF